MSPSLLLEFGQVGTSHNREVARGVRMGIMVPVPAPWAVWGGSLQRAGASWAPSFPFHNRAINLSMITGSSWVGRMGSISR